VGKAARHANRATLCLTPRHGRDNLLRKPMTNIGAALQHAKAAAEQFKELDHSDRMVRCIRDRIAPVIGPPRPPPALPATGELPNFVLLLLCCLGRWRRLQCPLLGAEFVIAYDCSGSRVPVRARRKRSSTVR
jgi:hypothetical protein